MTGVRFLVMHATDAHWESGASPGPDLLAHVGSLLGELAGTGTLLAAEGLRPTSDGVRLAFSGGTRAIQRGPFAGGSELPAGFSIVRAASLDDAIEWATRQAGALGDGEVDIRPVTEAWDIGMAPRPAGVATRRYMVLRKATAATEAGAAPPPARRAELSRLIDETTRAGIHVVTETMRPSARGRRYTNTRDGVSIFDGPFVESKELLGGYVIVAAESLQDADRMARRYIEAVGSHEVDVRELD